MGAKVTRNQNLRLIMGPAKSGNSWRKERRIKPSMENERAIEAAFSTTLHRAWETTVLTCWLKTSKNVSLVASSLLNHQVCHRHSPSCNLRS